MYVKKHSVKPLLLIYLSEHDKHNLQRILKSVNLKMDTRDFVTKGIATSISQQKIIDFINRVHYNNNIIPSAT